MMIRRMTLAAIATPVVAVAILSSLASGQLPTSAGNANPGGEPDCVDCDVDKIRYFKLQVSSDGVATESAGRPGTAARSAMKFEWVETKEAPPRPAPIVAEAAVREAVVRVTCRTTPTNTSGRKSCNDEEVHTLPDGYVFVENDVRKHWHSDIGSSNTCSVTWDDRVEVIPGTGITQARTMRVKGHARSGHGYGERGHTDVTVRCKFVKYTQ
jgi:hypothetical protein